MDNLNKLTKRQLILVCKDKGIKGYSKKTKDEIINIIMNNNINNENDSVISDSENENINDLNSLTSLDEIKESLEETKQDDLYNLYDNYYYNKCINHCNEYETSEINQYYESVICMKEVLHTKPRKDTIETAYNKIKDKISNSLDDILNHTYNKLCVLPKGHSGDCRHNPIGLILKNNITADKIKSKIETSIYSVPGNDGYIYKNRAPRNFPIIIDTETERKFCNKKEKLCCAIPLCEYSSPKMMAAAYLDYLVYILSIRGINEIINHNNTIYKGYITLINSHKNYMKELFVSKNREIYNNDNYLICPVLRMEFTINDLVQIDRDSRIILSKTDIQMGHIQSRSETEWTIRGKNLSMMSRRGNGILDEDHLFSDDWVQCCKTASYGR